MKQNELFNKCCKNCDPRTREEVWKQMDKELGRMALEQAAEDCQEQMAQEHPNSSWDCADVRNAFKAGAGWMRDIVEKEIDDVLNACVARFGCRTPDYYEGATDACKYLLNKYKEQKNK